MAVGDALRRLCEEVGWSYAVFWKAIGAADPVHLVWEDGCCGHASCSAGSEAPESGCEPGTSVCTLVRKVMASQIHVVGEGTIGRAAFTGNHQWIVHDPAANDHNLRPELAAEMNHQFAAGIQTIAIIPVLPRGVLQLGSTSVVVENTNLVLQYKKLCSQLNNRSSMASSSSVKNDLNQKVQSRPLNGPTSIYPADTRSKFLNGSPMRYQQCYGPDGTTVSSSTLANMGSNASMLMVAQRNGQVGKEHILYAPDMRFSPQNPYCDRRVQSNTQSSAVSSGFISSISASMERHPLMTNSQQLEQGNTGEPSYPRNVLLKSLAYRNPLVHENTNMTLLHDRGQVPGFVNGHGGFDFLPEESDLFDMFGSEFHHLCRNVDNDLTWKAAKPSSNRDVPESSVHLGSSPAFNSVDDEFPYSGIFSLTDTDQLLDAVVSNSNPGGKQISGDSASCKTSVTDIPSTSYCRLKEPRKSESSGAPLLIKNELAVSNFVKQTSFPEKAEDGCLSQNNAIQKSQIRLWIESGQNMKCERENPKPRPKDRQLIQDRIKELRELVPNGAKCSIDALLEKTIKHMLFLQSVTKHADNLKDSNESKILGGENGPLKDYLKVVPLGPLMLMLCEDRGIFLEIADFIKGLGLTILRGVMEAQKNKIWARFTVEANRDVTRMEIFLSLMRLLEPSCDGGGAGENPNNNTKMPLGIVRYPVIPATGHLR
ncbi:unnamed protein product [Miscanthus lutarioriparius]|uniref:BHLH domain-containing protein n=1 Tax=Miscanthus lutarioriparius TaxID=422564 RepID=A0A811RKJ1_9POAL|nr:unnamed protein product [Miscanthus lutarioriparius]